MENLKTDNQNRSMKMEKNNIYDSAYFLQSLSLARVQEIGPTLEREIKEKFNWANGRMIYYEDLSKNIIYDIQVDACYPNVNAPQAFTSVTYCNPDTPGHSNENKLQLKLGELMLFKAKYPQIRAILVIGGTKEAWLSYVLQAFEYFFDTVIYTWEKNFESKINAIKADPLSIPCKHSEIWKKLSNEWESTKLFYGTPINSFLRERTWNYMKKNGCEGDVPSKIKNKIIRNCMQAAYNCSVETRARSGVEWHNYMNEKWEKLWQSRSFFNPAEAAIEIILEENKISHLGGIAVDAEVPSLIHYLGGSAVDNTKVSEDYIVFSKKFNMPVFIQSKSTGGGKERHGKNIQNRTKEQIARSLFYRGYIENNTLKIREKDFIWISVLDGDWGVTKKTPLKYIHMLQWAGYDYLVSADSMVDDDLNVRSKDSELAKILKELDCMTDNLQFKERWLNWGKGRK